MTKAELIKHVSENYPPLTDTQIEIMVNEIFQTIKESSIFQGK